VPEKGLTVTWSRGELWKDGQKIGDAATDRITGAFDRGVFCTLEEGGGAVVLIGTGNGLTYEYHKGNITIYYRPKADLLIPGETIHYTVLFAGAGGGTPEQRTTTAQMVQFAKLFGVLEPGKPGYAPKMLAGKSLDTYFYWTVDTQGTAVRARMPKTAMPGFLPVAIDGVNDNWSVFLLDAARKGDNFRALPLRDGRAWAQLDLNLADSDLFLGHPVTASDPRMTLLVSWKQDGQWTIEAHNSTGNPLTATLATTPGWPKFDFKQTVTLAPGGSQTWTVVEKK
jgi:transposase